uniref:Reverse transcriptase n=1 Tax=Meloidogyne hapla TaxID=6305 RepID=A0A1I8BY08_MELHA
MDRFCGDGCSSRRILCMKLWHRSKDDDGLRLFTDCARSALGKRNLFIEENEGRTTTLLLLTDFRHFWARDIWLTESEWNEERDFFLHGFKRKYVQIFIVKPIVRLFGNWLWIYISCLYILRWQNSTKWGGWFSPFCLDNAKLSLEMTAIKCAKSGSQVKNIWQYEPRFMITREKLDIQLIARVREMRMQQMDYWRRIEEYALEEWKDTSETL